MKCTLIITRSNDKNDNSLPSYIHSVGLETSILLLVTYTKPPLIWISVKDYMHDKQQVVSLCICHNLFPQVPLQEPTSEPAVDVYSYLILLAATFFSCIQYFCRNKFLEKMLIGFYSYFSCLAHHILAMNCFPYNSCILAVMVFTSLKLVHKCWNQ